MNVPAKTSFRAFWEMLMKPPAPASRVPNRLTLTFPSRVGLRHAQASEIEPAAVVEVELLVLLDYSFGIERRAEIKPALRNAADDTWLGGQGQVLEHFLLGGNRGNALGHSDSEVHDTAEGQFERARRAMILRSSSAIGSMRSSGTRTAPEKAGLYGRAVGLEVILRAAPTTTQSTRMPGTLDLARIERTCRPRCARPAR